MNNAVKDDRFENKGTDLVRQNVCTDCSGHRQWFDHGVSIVVHRFRYPTDCDAMHVLQCRNHHIMAIGIGQWKDEAARKNALRAGREQTDIMRYDRLLVVQDATDDCVDFFEIGRLAKWALPQHRGMWCSACLTFWSTTLVETYEESLAYVQQRVVLVSERCWELACVSRWDHMSKVRQRFMLVCIANDFIAKTIRSMHLMWS